MKIPEHVAIIMDGNGRWAKRQGLPRILGHKQGVESVRAVVKAAIKHGVKYLTLFTFSSENSARPKDEVSFLFSLLLQSLRKETAELHSNDVCIKIIGDKASLNIELQSAIENAQQLTALNQKLQLNLAINFSGKWDIINAVKKLAHKLEAKELAVEDITEGLFQSALSLSDCPPPDLLIRTSGEMRISNFLLWDFAYTELYFTESYWPDFREEDFLQAIREYNKRERRFGLTSEQKKFSLPLIEQCLHA